MKSTAANKQSATPDTTQPCTETHGTAQADALFASIGDGVVAINELGRVYRVNKAALALLGYEEHEIIGKWFPRVVSAINDNGTPVKRMERATTRALLTGQTISERTFYRTKYVAKLPIFVTVSPIMLDGHPAGAIEVFRDASNEYQLDRMKSEFISFASHQLRTPLTAMLTYTNMLLQGFQGEVPPEQASYLKIILSSGNRMNELIDTLLNVSRMDAGNARINISEVKLDVLLRNVAEEVWSLAEKRKQHITMNLTQRHSTVKTDPLLITEALTNLLSNAIKYTPEGGSITIELEMTRGLAHISVADTGHGIPASLQNKVFSKFFRAPNILQEQSVGTGLGLYMVKQIIDSLGGSINFTSKIGNGTTFTITLPVNPPRNVNKHLNIT